MLYSFCVYFWQCFKSHQFGRSITKAWCCFSPDSTNVFSVCNICDQRWMKNNQQSIKYPIHYKWLEEETQQHKLEKCQTPFYVNPSVSLLRYCLPQKQILLPPKPITFLVNLWEKNSFFFLFNFLCHFLCHFLFPKLNFSINSLLALLHKQHLDSGEYCLTGLLGCFT